MVTVCEASVTRSTFNHRRRFGAPFRRNLLRASTIGALRRMEATCDNLFDWRTHWFDALFFNDKTPAEWVIGQIGTCKLHTIFGVAVESQGISQFRFRNGVTDMLLTGDSAFPPLIISSTAMRD